ncbi:MAG: hypothetical protein LQ346_004409 [Caloplaca aetnensis]|nr:MAG: hypothetical protein LQ346_004409 [Caloplaca aetnensis]
MGESRLRCRFKPETLTNNKGIAHLNGIGDLGGWRWIFILEGSLTVLVAATAHFFIYNYPATASFLNSQERARIHARFKASGDETRNEGFHLQECFARPEGSESLVVRPELHTMGLPLYTHTLSLFLLTITRELGYTAAQAQLVTIPPYSAAIVLTLSVAIASERSTIRAFLHHEHVRSGDGVLHRPPFQHSSRPCHHPGGGWHLLICRHCALLASEHC